MCIVSLLRPSFDVSLLNLNVYTFFVVVDTYNYMFIVIDSRAELIRIVKPFAWLSIEKRFVYLNLSDFEFSCQMAKVSKYWSIFVQDIPIEILHHTLSVSVLIYVDFKPVWWCRTFIDDSNTLLPHRQITQTPFNFIFCINCEIKLLWCELYNDIYSCWTHLREEK